jgi:hypothetical protein
MTKKELMEMIAHLNDDDVVRFVVETYDRDGFPEDTIAKVYKVVGPKAERVTENYGITRYKEV